MATPVVAGEAELPPPAGGSDAHAGAHQRRILARALDLLIFLALAWAVPPLGAGLGLVFLLVADAFWRGQSPGKRLFGVTVLRLHSGRGGNLWTSVRRNLPMAVLFLMLLMPMVSWIVFPLLGLPLLLLETRLTAVGKLGQRLGDMLADSWVADTWRAPPEPAARVDGSTP